MLNKEEIRVLEVMDQGGTSSTFEEIKEMTAIPHTRLQAILEKFRVLGVVSEVQAERSICIEDEKKKAVVHIFKKK